jgi:hypothetical protein
LYFFSGSFVFKFTAIVILIVLINIIGFNLFQRKIVFEIIKNKNEKNLGKNKNILDRYIEERKKIIFENSKKVIKNIENI